ncbi:hypothetical protein ScPMuIL_003230 [Solemya velum]
MNFHTVAGYFVIYTAVICILLSDCAAGGRKGRLRPDDSENTDDGSTTRFRNRPDNREDKDDGSTTRFRNRPDNREDKDGGSAKRPIFWLGNREDTDDDDSSHRNVGGTWIPRCSSGPGKKTDGGSTKRPKYRPSNRGNTAINLCDNQEACDDVLCRGNTSITKNERFVKFGLEKNNATIFNCISGWSFSRGLITMYYESGENPTQLRDLCYTRTNKNWTWLRCWDTKKNISNPCNGNTGASTTTAPTGFPESSSLTTQIDVTESSSLTTQIDVTDTSSLTTQMDVTESSSLTTQTDVTELSSTLTPTEATPHVTETNSSPISSGSTTKISKTAEQSQESEGLSEVGTIVVPTLVCILLIAILALIVYVSRRKMKEARQADIGLCENPEAEDVSDQDTTVVKTRTAVMRYNPHYSAPLNEDVYTSVQRKTT